MKSVLMPLAPGFEEIEALATVDILRRAGAEVTIAGTVAGPIQGRCKVRVLPDTTMDAADPSDYDMIVLPGGAGGTEKLKNDERVKAAVLAIADRGGFAAAICAAPTILSAIGLTEGRSVTSHPSVRAALRAEKVLDERVVVDGNLITSQGPGTAIEFALKLVELLFDKEKAEEVGKGVLAIR